MNHINKKIMKQNKIFGAACILFLLLAVSCGKDEATTALQNDCIKRTLGPNVAGLNIEFAYAMALPPAAGKIVAAQVEASIAGATGTWMENKSYHLSAGGADEGVEIGAPSVTSDTKTEVTFNRDTCAATLRYYYLIPEDAKGKDVTFTFSVKASNGESVSYQMGPYAIAKMDMALDLTVTDNADCYLSIADLTVYDAVTAAANPSKIDLVYLYRNIPTVAFAHALVAPAADAQYLPGLTLPAGASNNTLIRKVYQLRDRHLARLQYGIYVDDPDFLALDFTNMPNYAINLLNEHGLWVQTHDGAYRAYIYINAVNAAGDARISIKRYTM
jgi:hypothetical protein